MHVRVRVVCVRAHVCVSACLVSSVLSVRVYVAVRILVHVCVYVCVFVYCIEKGEKIEWWKAGRRV